MIGKCLRGFPCEAVYCILAHVTGQAVAEEVLSVERGGTQDAEDLAATAEHVKLLMEDCKKMLISESDVVLGAWGLIDADPV
jgi:hypothetical protein